MFFVLAFGLFGIWLLISSAISESLRLLCWPSAKPITSRVHTGEPITGSTSYHQGPVWEPQECHHCWGWPILLQRLRNQRDPYPHPPWMWYCPDQELSSIQKWWMPIIQMNTFHFDWGCSHMEYRIAATMPQTLGLLDTETQWLQPDSLDGPAWGSDETSTLAGTGGMCGPQNHSCGWKMGLDTESTHCPHVWWELVQYALHSQRWPQTSRTDNGLFSTAPPRSLGLDLAWCCHIWLTWGSAAWSALLSYNGPHTSGLWCFLPMHPGSQPCRRIPSGFHGCHTCHMPATRNTILGHQRHGMWPGRCCPGWRVLWYSPETSSSRASCHLNSSSALPVLGLIQPVVDTASHSTPCHWYLPCLRGLRLLASKVGTRSPTDECMKVSWSSS